MGLQDEVMIAKPWLREVVLVYGLARQGRWNVEDIRRSVRGMEARKGMMVVFFNQFSISTRNAEVLL